VTSFYIVSTPNSLPLRLVRVCVGVVSTKCSVNRHSRQDGSLGQPRCGGVGHESSGGERGDRSSSASSAAADQSSNEDDEEGSGGSETDDENDDDEEEDEQGEDDVEDLETGRRSWRRCQGLQALLRRLSARATAFRARVRQFVDGDHFTRGILLAILINTLSMGVEHHKQVNRGYIYTIFYRV